MRPLSDAAEVAQAVLVAIAQAGRRTRRYMVWADEDDLRQEAWAHALRVLPALDRERGKIGAYVQRCARNGAIELALRAQSPVSSSKWGERAAMARCRHEKDDVLAGEGPYNNEGESSARAPKHLREQVRHVPPHDEAAVDHDRWLRKVRRRLRALGDRVDAELAKDPELRLLWQERPR